MSLARISPISSSSKLSVQTMSKRHNVSTTVAHLLQNHIYTQCAHALYYLTSPHLLYMQECLRDRQQRIVSSPVHEHQGVT